ncbi:2-hydroxyacylsphingosine 1-beta-galactosyltransferase-like [Lytechinus pictus]|uniref:2-hydroxyacylsphingosine 1-beta-galactosyltransferase-like n=1 Tax=Lytechinus pictus TaxID=7653 RepID=UPI0030B9FBE3
MSRIDYRVFILICLVVWIIRSSDGARILLSSEEGSGSHFSVLSTIGHALIDKGHHVTALISEANKDMATDDKFRHLKFDIFPDSTMAYTKDWMAFVVSNEMKKTIPLPSPRAIYGIFKRCQEQVDHAIENKRKGIKYDLLILDFHKPCSVVLAGALDTPYVFVVPSGIKPSQARRYGTSSTTAYYPEMSSGLQSEMGFFNRFSNTLTSIREDLSIFFMYDVYFFLLSFHFSLSPRVSHIMSGSELILINSDFAVDFPFPLHPNVITIGGLSARTPNALNEEWMKLMSASQEHGVVIFSLGTYADGTLTMDDIKTIARVFSLLKQTVVWQSKQDIHSDVSLSPNIKVFPWIPQNDLLGHPSVRLLIFHGGNNGMHEAVYHGTPMVVIPLGLDHFDVAARVVQRGIGLPLDFSRLTQEHMLKAINTVLHDSSFKASAQRASEIMRGRLDHPLNRSVHWIEHVLKYKGSYLRPSSSKMYFWQLYLLDIYIAMAIMSFIAYKLLKLVLRLSIRLWNDPYMRDRTRRCKLISIKHMMVICVLFVLLFIFLARV